MNDIIGILKEGAKLKVTIRPGHLGCADAQDACDQFGFLILYQRNDQFRIDDPEGENIVCVDDGRYLQSIIDTAEFLK